MAHSSPFELAFKNGGDRESSEYGVCYTGSILPATGFWSFWEGSSNISYLDYMLPPFLIQLIIAVLISRLLMFLLNKYFRQTHIIAFMVGGLVLGPSCMLALFPRFKALFAVKGLVLLDAMGIMGLLYYFFILGLKMDISVIKTAVGRIGILLAFIDIAVTTFMAVIIGKFVLKSKEDHIPSSKVGNYIDYTIPRTILGVAASMTGFPVLNRIIMQLRLSNTKMGIMATSCSIVETAFVFLLLPLVFVLSLHPESMNDPQFTPRQRIDYLFLILLIDIVVIILCFYVVRPVIRLIVRRTSDGINFNEVFVTFILVGVMFLGFLTDTFGSHIVLGPFVLGLAISYGSLGISLVGRLEDFVYGIILPLYFVVIGLRTHPFGVTVDGEKFVTHMRHPFLIIFACASIVKIVVALIVSKYEKMPYLEGIILGLLLNTKGFIQLIVFNYGHDIQGLMDDKSYAYAIYLTLLITGMIPLIIGAIYKPTLLLVAYKRRSVQKPKGDPELRILPCFHDPRRSVPAIINLLRFFQPTKKNPFSIYALYLLEQTADHGAASTTLIDRCTSGNHTDIPHQPHYDQIVKAFENYQRNLVDAVNVHALTTIAPYNAIYEEVCNVADTKGIALIIVPFHKQQIINGSLEETNLSYRDINEDILNNAPCSVAIFVDRGLGGGGGDYTILGGHVIVLFFGGPDDREALSLAWRMTENPNVSLTVLHLLPADDTLKLNEATQMNDMGVLKVIIDTEKEKQRDEDYINEFKKKMITNRQSKSILYKEQMLNDVQETLSLIKSIDKTYDLFIVGRGLGMTNPLTTGLIDFSECPELGAIGDLLASPDFAMTTTSVLIVQQYVGAINDGSSSGTGTPTSSNKQYCDLYDNYYNLNRMPSSSDSSATLFRRRT